MLDPRYKTITVTAKKAKTLKRLVICPKCKGAGFLDTDDEPDDYGGYPECDQCGHQGIVVYKIRREKK